MSDSSVAAENLEQMRGDRLVQYDPVFPAAGPPYRCTPAGELKPRNFDSRSCADLVERFLKHPGGQRLLRAKAVFALRQQPERHLEWLVEVGAQAPKALNPLELAQELVNEASSLATR